MNKSNILTIIPAYNESQHIAQVLDRIRQYLPESDLLVVDDGSVDDTRAIAMAKGAGCVSLFSNRGYGIALQTGYKFAMKNGYEYILQLDADGQHEPVCLQDILAELKRNEVDIIIGSRFLHPESYKPPFIRSIGMSVFSFLTSRILKQRISDPTSGFQGFRARVLPFLTSDFFPVDYPDADAIIMMDRCRFRIKEIPVIMRPGTKKSMHRGTRPIYYVFKMFLSVFVTLLRRYNVYENKEKK